jgi:hypothetical protein
VYPYTGVRRISCTAVALLLLAGCGSSSPPKHSGGRPQAIAFAACMRTHGVPSFPDPGSGGGIQLPPGINPFSPGFKDAQRSCGKLLPGGGPGRGGTASESQKLSMLHLSECMRAHGLPGFPDPTTTLPPNGPPPNTAIAFGRPGLVLIVPNEDGPAQPAFKSAAKTCHFPGF